MPWPLFRRLIVLTTLLAFVGGMTLQLMPPRIALAAPMPLPATGDCQQMAARADVGPSHTMPCKGIDAECVKLMGCIGMPTLPRRLNIAGVTFAYSKIAYWMPASVAGGRSIKPELLPPIGL